MRHHRWFKILALLIPLVLLAAACGDDGDEPEGDASASAAASEEEAASEGDGGDGASVGLVFDLAGRGDKSFNDAAAAGLDRAEAELGITAKELEPNEGGENREELLRLLADEGSDLIFGIGFLFADSFASVAPDHPDARFAIVDAVVEADNVASLVFAEHEGSFLVGAAAALKSTTGTIGFIGGMEIDLIKKFEAGYTAGAKHVDPDIEVEVTYLSQPPDDSGFNNPGGAQEAAAAMYEGGADIVYHAAGGSGSGLFTAAAEHSAGGEKVWAIGVDSDQYETAGPEVQEFILTSMVKEVDVAVFDAVKRFQDGEEIGGTVTAYDLVAGGIDYSRSGGFVDDIADQLDELKEQIISGAITVPETPEG